MGNMTSTSTPCRRRRVPAAAAPEQQQQQQQQLRQSVVSWDELSFGSLSDDDAIEGPPAGGPPQARAPRKGSRKRKGASISAAAVAASAAVESGTAALAPSAARASAQQQQQQQRTVAWDELSLASLSDDATEGPSSWGSSPVTARDQASGKRRGAAIAAVASPARATATATIAAAATGKSRPRKGRAKEQAAAAQTGVGALTASAAAESSAFDADIPLDPVTLLPGVSPATHQQQQGQQREREEGKEETERAAGEETSECSSNSSRGRRKRLRGGLWALGDAESSAHPSPSSSSTAETIEKEGKKGPALSAKRRLELNRKKRQLMKEAETFAKEMAELKGGDTSDPEVTKQQHWRALLLQQLQQQEATAAAAATETPGDDEGWQALGPRGPQIGTRFGVMRRDGSEVRNKKFSKVLLPLDATLGEVATALAAEVSLPPCCSCLITFRLDGDIHPHHTKLGSESLDLEEGIQIDVLLPQSQGPLPHQHDEQRTPKEYQPFQEETDDAVALADGTFLIID